MIHKDSSKHVVCSMCSAAADPDYRGNMPLCELHAGTLLKKQAASEERQIIESIRELANRGDIHHADE